MKNTLFTTALWREYLHGVWWFRSTWRCGRLRQSYGTELSVYFGCFRVSSACGICDECVRNALSGIVEQFGPDLCCYSDILRLQLNTQFSSSSREKLQTDLKPSLHMQYNYHNVVIIYKLKMLSYNHTHTFNTFLFIKGIAWLTPYRSFSSLSISINVLKLKLFFTFAESCMVHVIAGGFQKQDEKHSHEHPKRR